MPNPHAKPTRAHRVGLQPSQTWHCGSSGWARRKEHLPDELSALLEHAGMVDNEVEKLQKYRASMEERFTLIDEEKEEKEKAAESALDRAFEEKGRMLDSWMVQDVSAMLREIPLRRGNCLTIPDGNGYLHSLFTAQSAWENFEDCSGMSTGVDKALRTRSGEHCRPEEIKLGTLVLLHAFCKWKVALA